MHEAHKVMDEQQRDSQMLYASLAFGNLCLADDLRFVNAHQYHAALPAAQITSFKHLSLRDAIENSGGLNQIRRFVDERDCQR